VENFFQRLKEFKRIAQRACKTDLNFSPMIYLAASVIRIDERQQALESSEHCGKYFKLTGSSHFPLYVKKSGMNCARRLGRNG
jgi:hypothetical protein